MTEKKIKFSKMGFAKNRFWVTSEIVGSEAIADEILTNLKDFSIRKKTPKPGSKTQIKDVKNPYNTILAIIRMDGHLWVRTDQAPDWVDEKRLQGIIPPSKTDPDFDFDKITKYGDYSHLCFFCKNPISTHRISTAKRHLAKVSKEIKKAKEWQELSKL